jgi:hypothetical protein
MANTYTLIASYTATGSVASIDFTSIPSTYTDLCLKLSLRPSVAGNSDMYISFNSSTTNFSGIYLQGNGTTAPSGSLARYIGTAMGQTSSTFTNGEIYIPNYASSNNKSFSVDFVAENNATLAYSNLVAGLWSNSAAITSISVGPGSGSIVQYSTAYLYGISKS